MRGKTQPVKIYGVLPADLRKHPRAVLDVAATVVLLTVRARAARSRPATSARAAWLLGGVPRRGGRALACEIRCEGGLLPSPLLAEGVIAWRRGDAAGITFTGLAAEVAPAVAEFVSHRSPR